MQDIKICFNRRSLTVTRHPSLLRGGNSGGEILGPLGFLQISREDHSLCFSIPKYVKNVVNSWFVEANWPKEQIRSMNFFSPKLFLALTSPVMKYLTPVIVVILEGVGGVAWFPVSLAPISVSRGENLFYKCCWQYTELNKVLIRLVSHMNLDEVIEAVAFDFDCTS